MNEIKVSLNIILPGRVLISKRDCLKKVKENYVDKRGHKRTKIHYVEDWDKFDMFTMKVSAKGEGTDILNIHTRKTKPATQSINMSKEAYDYMTSVDSNIGSPSTWRQMSKTKRLEAHLNRYAESLGGTLGDYVVFED